MAGIMFEAILCDISRRRCSRSA